jgi:hypothetical protein
MLDGAMTMLGRPFHQGPVLAVGPQRQPLDDGTQRRAAGLVQGIPVDPGADRREGDASTAVLDRQLEAAAVRSGQRFGLARFAAVPDGAHGVEHESCR